MRSFLFIMVVAACATDPGAEGLVPGDASRVTIHSTGGFAANPPGSTCSAFDETYTVDLATHGLAYSVCRATTDGGPNSLQTGTATILDADLPALADALHALPAQIPECSGDLVDHLTVETPRGTTTYANTQCLTGELELVGELRTLAFSRARVR